MWTTHYRTWSKIPWTVISLSRQFASNLMVTVIVLVTYIHQKTGSNSIWRMSLLCVTQHGNATTVEPLNVLYSVDTIYPRVLFDTFRLKFPPTYTCPLLSSYQRAVRGQDSIDVTWYCELCISCFLLVSLSRQSMVCLLCIVVIIVETRDSHTSGMLSIDSL